MTKVTDTVSKMEKARQIVLEAYRENGPDENPRKAAIDQMKKSVADGGLGMKNTTAATYHAHCIAYFREQQQNDAKQKLEKGKPVWTAVKTDSKGKITSAGLFTTKKAATEFNKQFYHDGVIKGVVEVGQQLKVA